MEKNALINLRGVDQALSVTQTARAASGKNPAGPAAAFSATGSFAQALNQQMTGLSATGETRSARGTLITTPRPGESANETLNRSQTIDEAADRHAKAVKAAEGLVSNALILPILKQVRRSSFGENSVFSGGNGEKSFGPEFDMQLADRIAHSPRLGVKNALVTKLEKRGNATQNAKTPANKIPAAATARIDLHG